MTRKKKVTKKIFEQANRLYNQIVNDPHAEVNSLCEGFNNLIEEYDFDTKVFADENGLEGVKTCLGEVMIPAKYDKILFHTTIGIPQDEVYAIAAYEDKECLIDSKSNEILKADVIRPLNGKTITPVMFKRNGKRGIAHSEEKMIVEPRYDNIICGSNGFYFLSLDGKEGFIDPWGNVVEPKFDSIEIDDEDYFEVTLGGESGYIDENGEFTPDRAEAYYNYNFGL